jgi:hypothetical protein
MHPSWCGKAHLHPTFLRSFGRLVNSQIPLAMHKLYFSCIATSHLLVYLILNALHKFKYSSKNATLVHSTVCWNRMCFSTTLYAAIIIFRISFIYAESLVWPSFSADISIVSSLQASDLPLAPRKYQVIENHIDNPCIYAYESIYQDLVTLAPKPLNLWFFWNNNFHCKDKVHRQCGRHLWCICHPMIASTWKITSSGSEHVGGWKARIRIWWAFVDRQVFFWRTHNRLSFVDQGQLHTRDWEPVTITLRALSLVEKLEPVQVRFTLHLRDQRSMWMQDGCKVYMDSYMDQMNHVSWSLGLFSKNHLLEVGLIQIGRPRHFKRSQPMIYSMSHIWGTRMDRKSLK